MRRAEQLALEVVGPAVQRADDVGGIAAPAEHDGLAVAADVGKKLHPLAVAHEHPCIVGPGKRMVVARRGHHQLVADVVWARIEQKLLLEGENLRVEIPRHRQLGAGRAHLRDSRDVDHSL